MDLCPLGWNALYFFVECLKCMIIGLMMEMLWKKIMQINVLNDLLNVMHCLKTHKIKTFLIYYHYHEYQMTWMQQTWSFEPFAITVFLFIFLVYNKEHLKMALLKLDHTAFSYSAMSFGAQLMDVIFSFYYVKVNILHV